MSICTKPASLNEEYFRFSNQDLDITDLRQSLFIINNQNMSKDLLGQHTSTFWVFSPEDNLCLAQFDSALDKVQHSKLNEMNNFWIDLCDKRLNVPRFVSLDIKEKIVSSSVAENKESQLKIKTKVVS